MDLLIPALALAIVAIVLLLAMGKILGGHAAARQPQEPEVGDAIRPPSAPAPLPPPAPSAPAGLEPGFNASWRSSWPRVR